MSPLQIIFYASSQKRKALKGGKTLSWENERVSLLKFEKKEFNKRKRKGEN